MVGYKETTEDGTETYKYKNPNNTSADDEYVPVSKEQYDNLKEQQSGDPNSSYTKYEIKDGHYTETECEKTSAGEKALKETTQDENGVTTQIKENQYDENNKFIHLKDEREEKFEDIFKGVDNFSLYQMDNNFDKNKRPLLLNF